MPLRKLSVFFAFAIRALSTVPSWALHPHWGISQGWHLAFPNSDTEKMPTCSRVALPGVEGWQGLSTFMASPVPDGTRRISGSCYQHCSRVGPALTVWKQRRPRRSCKRQQLHTFVWILAEVWIIFWVCFPTSARYVLPHVATGTGMCYLKEDLRE